MNKDEVAGWIKTAISEREKINIYRSNIQDIYGEKNPNFQISVNGQMKSIKQMGLDLQRYSQTIDALTMKALDDDVLTEEEAKALMMISPSQGVGATQFNTLVDSKRKIAEGKYEQGQNLIYNDSLKIVSKMLSSQGDMLSNIDMVSLLGNIGQDANISKTAAAAVPNMDAAQYTDANGNIVTLQAITNAMSEEEKIQGLIDRVSAGQVDSGTLSTYFTSILDKGSRELKEANKIWNAFGGREQYFGLDKGPVSSDEILSFDLNLEEGDKIIKPSTQDMTSKVDEMKSKMSSSIEGMKEEVKEEGNKVYGNIDLSDINLLATYGDKERGEKIIRRRAETMPLNANENLAKQFLESGRSPSWNSFINNNDSFFKKDMDNIVDVDVNQLKGNRKSLTYGQAIKEIRRIAKGHPSKIYKFQDKYYTLMQGMTHPVLKSVVPGSKKWNELKSQ